MMSHDLQSVALTLVATGKGILAADETIPTLTRRFDALGIQSTEHSRRTCREMLFTSLGRRRIHKRCHYAGRDHSSKEFRFPALRSRTRLHAFVHGTSCPSRVRRTSPKVS